MGKLSSVGALKKILAHLPGKQKRDLTALCLLMVVGAIAELLSLGILFVFLAILADAGTRANKAIQLIEWVSGLTERHAIIDFTTVAFLIGITLSTGVRIFMAWRTNMFVLALGRELNSELYRQIINKPYLFHTQLNSAGALSLIEKTQSVADQILSPVLQACSAAVLSIFIVAGLLVLDPVLVGGVMAVVGGSYVIMSLAVRKRLDINSQTIAAKEYGRILLVQESMGGIRDIILRGVQPFYLGRYRDTEQSLRRSKAVNNFIAIMPRTLIEAIGITVIALAAYVISGQPGGVVGALPVLGALALGAQRLMPQAQIMYTGWALLVGNHAVLREVADAFSPAEKTEADKALALAAESRPIDFQREVKLDAIRFKYATRPKPALDGVTLAIVKGERLGIVGKTGSGKSTLVDILMGLVTPDEGALSVDGRVLTEVDLVNWRRRIAHVPQSIYFNDASVASNIAFGMHEDEIDMDRVRDAAKRAKIADFLEGLDHGYATVVGERGVQLSGGQRQRIAIARAFYFNDTDIFVFDEATSALDSQTERDVISALDDIADDVTVIMIAHRVMTLERCDRIVHMADAHITHIGPPSELDTAATG